MNKFYVILLSLVCLLVSCNAQTQTRNFEWKEYIFDDAGVKVMLPCEMKRELVVLQNKPRLVRTFGFKCDSNDVTFVIELSENFGELDNSQMQQKLKDEENNLKEIVGQKNNFESKNFLYQGKLNASILDITNLTTFWRQVNVVNARGVYRALIFFREQEGESKKDFENEFENTSKKFFDSFQIFEK